MVTDIVTTVRSDNSNRSVAITTEEDLKKKTPRKKAEPKADATPKTSAPSAQTAKGEAPAGFRPKNDGKASTKPSVKADVESIKASYNPDDMIGMPCPLCHQGTIIKGKTAYGCSRWKEGCTYRQMF